MKFRINTSLVLLSLVFFANTVASENQHLRRNTRDDTHVSPDQATPLTAEAQNVTRVLNQAVSKSARILQYGYNARILQYGYKLNDEPFTPVSRHLGSQQIFDPDKIADYANQKFIPEDNGEIISIIEERVETFAREMKTELNVEGSYRSKWLGGSMTVSAAAELGLSEALDTENYYAQNRKVYTFGFVQLPDAKELLQKLLNQDTLRDLKGIRNITRARQLVNKLGVGYLHKTYYGATFVMTTVVEKEEWMDETSVRTSLSASYESFAGNAASGQTSTSMTIQENGKSTKSEVTLRVEGGDPTKMENESAWKESAEARPVVTEYNVSPLYELLKTTGSEGTARTLLKQAVEEKIDNFVGNMPSFDPDEYWKMLYHHRGDSRTRTVYSNTFSEENGGYSGRMNGPIRAIKCSGGYCDNKRLVAVQHGYKKAVVPSNNPYWTSWFSQEGKKDARNKRTCPDDMVVNQIQCKGAYCDKMRLGCGVMASGYRVSHEHTMETGFFSEEQGEEQCDDGYYIYGIECSGSYCDNIKLYCARIQYLYKPPKKSWKALHNYDSRFTNSRWFSEENGGYSGRQVTPVAGIICSGRHCDNKSLTAINLKGEAIVNNSNHWTQWFSEEGQNYRYCPSDMVMNEVQCKGGFCDNMRLKCGTLKNGYRVNRSKTKPVEMVKTNISPKKVPIITDGYCPDGYYIYGLACSGPYCDNIKLHCALVQYYG